MLHKKKLKFNSFKIFINTILSFLILINTSLALPDLSSEARAQMSPKDEKLIGKIITQSLYQSKQIYPEPLVNEYIKYLGNKLLVAANFDAENINFFVTPKTSINAVTFLGGVIYVHSGLITASHNESELAAVLAHEIAHAKQHHILRSMVNSKKMLPVTIVEIIGAILIGQPDLIIPVMAGQTQKTLNFSRKFEKEADNIGIDILAKSGFDPQGMPDIFNNMEKASRYDGKPPEYLLTHPLFKSRISESRNRANNYNYKQTISSDFFNLTRARVTVDHCKNLRNFIKLTKESLIKGKYSDVLDTKYKYAYALYKSGKLDKSYNLLRDLSQEYKDNFIIKYTLAEIDIAQSNYNSAINKLEPLYTNHPESNSIALLLAESYVKNKQAIKAQNILGNVFTNKKHIEPIAYELLMQTYDLTKDKARLHIAKAEWFNLQGQQNQALSQLKLAQDNTEDKILISQIKSREKNLQDFIVKRKSL